MTTGMTNFYGQLSSSQNPNIHRRVSKNDVPYQQPPNRPVCALFPISPAQSNERREEVDILCAQNEGGVLAVPVTAPHNTNTISQNQWQPVLWISIGFNADPDPSSYLKANPDLNPDPGSQTLGPQKTVKATFQTCLRLNKYCTLSS